MFRIICVTVVLFAACNGQAEEETVTRNPICKTRNGYYSIENNCDAYIECRDFMAKNMQCPDGLHYDPDAQWPAYPCGYPMDVTCQGRGAPQPANPTADCPHQYGFYQSPLATPEQCGLYRMCVEGLAIEMSCPPGLAFNPTHARCDWPDLVPTCKADAFLGFKCPADPLDASGKPIEGTLNYKYEGNCYAFFSCSNGSARLLMCDTGYAFNAEIGKCDNADNVKCDHVETEQDQ